MKEIIFIIKNSTEGGFEARAVNASIFCEAKTMEELKLNIEDAIKCHFDF